MNNQKRRPFRSRTNKSNYRGRGGSSRSNNNGHFQNKNGNNNFIRNGSMTNPFNVEKAIQKFLCVEGIGRTWENQRKEIEPAILTRRVQLRRKRRR